MIRSAQDSLWVLTAPDQYQLESLCLHWLWHCLCCYICVNCIGTLSCECRHTSEAWCSPSYLDVTNLCHLRNTYHTLLLQVCLCVCLCACVCRCSKASSAAGVDPWRPGEDGAWETASAGEGATDSRCTECQEAAGWCWERRDEEDDWWECCWCWQWIVIGDS